MQIEDAHPRITLQPMGYFTEILIKHEVFKRNMIPLVQLKLDLQIYLVTLSEYFSVKLGMPPIQVML
jgi:hypothetical protein